MVGFTAHHEPTLIARGLRLSVEEQHVALPKLYGAPAYARPMPMVDPTPRPFDRDELPIEAAMTDEERDIAEGMPARAYGMGPYGVAMETADKSGGATISARPLNLRKIAGRLLGGN
jgi:hypothetical protein